MKNVDLVYFVEHAARELDIACAVKYLLERDYGLSCEVASIVGDLPSYTARVRPKVVAIPYCVSVKDAGLEPLVAAWPDAPFVNLAFEQVLGKTQQGFKAPKDRFARNFVHHHAWGDFFAEYLQANGVPAENITVNGNPSLALYCPPYRAYFEIGREVFASRFGLDPEKRWIFIPENYGWAFFRDHMLRDRIRRGFNPEDAYRYRDFARDSLRESAHWWRKAGEEGRVEVIVRPRPAIPAQSFAQAIRDLSGELPPHLHVIKDGTVREWILASDIVLSSYSTTLLEAAVAAKPVYMLSPYPMPDFLYNEWYDLTAQLSTQEDFLQAMYSQPAEANWGPLEAWVRRQMMSRGDAIANLTALLGSVFQGETAVPRPAQVSAEVKRLTFDKLKRKVRKAGWNLLQDTAAALGIQTADRNWNPHEHDSFSPEEINRRVEAWARILG